MDTRAAAQLIQTAVPVVVALALVLAFRPRRRATTAEATRGRAEWLTVATGVPGAYLLVVTVMRATESNPLGILVFLATCAHLALSAVVLTWAWRAHRAALEDERLPPLNLDDEARRPHRGLGGEEAPPRRW